MVSQGAPYIAGLQGGYDERTDRWRDKFGTYVPPPSSGSVPYYAQSPVRQWEQQPQAQEGIWKCLYCGCYRPSDKLECEGCGYRRDFALAGEHVLGTRESMCDVRPGTPIAHFCGEPVYSYAELLRLEREHGYSMDGMPLNLRPIVPPRKKFLGVF